MPDTRKIKQRIMKTVDTLTDRAVMLATGWDEFLDGHWTLDVPTKPGGYFYADPAGYDRGVTYVNQELNVRGTTLSVSHSKGHYWYWSVPVPQMPPAPTMPIEGPPDE